jgi:hypothetical protein
MSFLTRRKEIYMADTGLPNVFNINELEQDIRDAVEQRPPVEFLPPEVREQEVSGDDVGRLSAEAVAAHHEEAARSLELLGNELKNSMDRIAQITQEAAKAFDFIRETAEAYRADGKVVADKIEKASGLIKEVHATCEALRGKLGA